MPSLRLGLAGIALFTLLTAAAVHSAQEASAARRTASSVARQVPGKRIRFPDPASVGLPENAHVNAAMFSGIVLSPDQARIVTQLAQEFTDERVRLLGDSANSRWTSEMKIQMLPFVERQRVAYRNVLTAGQHKAFDANVKRILDAWRQGADSGQAALARER